MQRIRVEVRPRPYEAVIHNGALDDAGSLLREVYPSERKQCFIVTVPVVRRKWGARLADSLKRTGWEPTFLLMPEGESYKTVATVETLAEKLTRAGADRNAVIIAFGG